MNKFVKGCLIAGGVMIVVGMLAGSAAVAAGGMQEVERMAENGELDYTVGSQRIRLLHDGCVINVMDKDLEWEDDEHYNVNFEWHFPEYDSGEHSAHEGREVKERLLDERVSDAPEVPDVPEVPDAPDVPEIPEMPEDPDLAQEQEASWSMSKTAKEMEAEMFAKKDISTGKLGFKGNFKVACATAEDVRELDLEVSGGSLQLMVSPDDRFYVMLSDVEDAYSNKVVTSVKLEKGTLLIEKNLNSAKKTRIISSNSDKLGNLYLYIPEGYVFRNAEISAGAASLMLKGLQADEVELENGACDVRIDGIRAGSLQIENGAAALRADNVTADYLELANGVGAVELAGKINREAEISNGMGDVRLVLSGNEKDYNYQVESALGEVTIGEGSFSALACDHYIDNQAPGEITVENGMGEVNILFR